MLLYYITDRRRFPGDAAAQRRALLAKIAEAARGRVDYIQLREKDLSTSDLEALAHEAAQIVRECSGHAKLLINSRTDVALAAAADGVHLPAGDICASDARALWDTASRNVRRETRNVIIGVSCHSLAEVLAAESHGADLAVFGPVFEKVVSGTAEARPASAGSLGVGLVALREVCRRGAPPDIKTESVASGRMPVLALGGITLANARACLEAGAAGIAGIRLFQENEISVVVDELRQLDSAL